MAETLALVIRKIGSILAEEATEKLRLKSGRVASFAREAKNLLKEIQNKLVLLQESLNEAEMHTGYILKEEWIMEVRKIGNEAERIIDEYAYFIGEQQHRKSEGWFWKGLQKSENIIAWETIFRQLKQVETRLHVPLEIPHAIEDARPINDLNNASEIQRPVQVSSNQMTEQEELVGFNEEKEKLVQWLRHGRETRSVIAVLGVAGSGKTSLVRNVFDSQVIKEHFNTCRVWISVSKKFQIWDILIRIFTKIAGTHTLFRGDCLDLLEIIRPILKSRRYLIVLDGLRSMDSGCRLDAAFVRNSLGSRVVITTRNVGLPSLAIGNYIELVGLGQDEAWHLFCSRAFRNEEGMCPPELEQWGRKIVSNCQRLPMVIITVGGLGSWIREKQEKQFMKLYEQVNQCDLTSNRWAANPLNLSCHYMPSYLKHCILYCSIFPEDAPIKRRRLIRLWIAEGFIEENVEKSPEEVAEEYLNELIQLSMLQVVEVNDFGRVKVCRMHDSVRELIVTNSLKDDVCALIDNPDVGYKTVRRLSINDHELSKDVLSSMDVAHTCSFLVFDTSSHIASLVSSVMSSFRCLRVLDLQGMPISTVPNAVGGLFNLHFLGLRETNVKDLPKSVSRLHNLQTLDLTCTEIEKLPCWICRLPHLRHLFAMRNTDDRYFVGFEAPNRLWDLKELQTLHVVRANDDFVAKLGNLTQLRSLSIQNVRSSHCEELWSSIAKMRFLSNLDIQSDDNEMLELQGLNPSPQHLQKLYLIGRLSERVNLSPFSQFHGKNLRWLTLTDSVLNADLLPSLSHFSTLTKLRLQNTYNGQKIRFGTGWFPNLVSLLLGRMDQLVEIEFEEGATQNLNNLDLICLQELKVVPLGIEFLTSLQKLVLFQMRPELVISLSVSDQVRVAHISEIFISDDSL